MSIAEMTDFGGTQRRRQTSYVPVLNESRSLIVLATPIAATSLLNLGMAITDVVMMGRLGAGAVAAGAIISDLYSIVFYLCAGILGAVAPEIAQAIGAKRPHAVRAATQQGFWMAAALGSLAFPVIWHAPSLLTVIGIDEAVVMDSRGYAQMMAITAIPMFGIAMWRNVYTALSAPRAIMVLTIIALPVNAALNYLFMFGAFGVAPMGVTGAGVSSALVAFGIFSALSVYAHLGEMFRGYHFLIRFARPKQHALSALVRVGVPIGFASFGEVGLFLISTMVAGLFGVEALAAHAVALRMAGVVYAFPSGLSQAATVRVAYAKGRRDEEGVKRSALTSLSIGAAGGLVLCFGLLASRHQVPGLFIAADGASGMAIMDLAAGLLALLSAVCLAQGIGTVGAGALRGLKDTRVPMVGALFGFWVIGLATMVSTSFVLGWGVEGIWSGIFAGALATAVLIGLRLAVSVLAASPFLEACGDGQYEFRRV